MASIRSFIAIDVPDTVRAFAEERQQILKEAGIHLKWVRPANIHLTLQFLGDVDTEKLPNIETALAAAAKSSCPFSLKAKGLGVFPNLKRPRVVWIGLDGQTDLLHDLYRQISASMVPEGFPEDKKDFKGHLTIGRVKGRINRQIESVISARFNDETPPFKVSSVYLFKSQLTPRGAIYTKLAQAPLNVL